MFETANQILDFDRPDVGRGELQRCATTQCVDGAREPLAGALGIPLEELDGARDHA